MSGFMWHCLVAHCAHKTPEDRARLRHEVEQRIRAIADKTVANEYRVEFRRRLNILLGDAPRTAYREGSVSRPRDGRRDSWHRRPIYHGETMEQRLRPEFNRFKSRDAQVLIACALHHPWVVVEQIERFAALVFADPILARLQAAILQAVSAFPTLDGAALQRHLSERSLGSDLERLVSGDLYRHARFYAQFALADAPAGAVRDGFLGLLNVLHNQDAEEGEQAEDARLLAENLSEDAWERYRRKWNLGSLPG